MNTQFLSTLEFALVPVPEYKVETKPYILLHRKSDMLLGTNRCEVQKALLVFDQSDKSSDSGLPAYDYTEYSCLPITRTFTRLLEPRANSNQNRFPQDFRHTLTVIFWFSISQTKVQILDYRRTTTQSTVASVIFWFSISQTKVQILDYRRTTTQSTVASR